MQILGGISAAPQQLHVDTKRLLFKHNTALESRGHSFYDELQQQLLEALATKRKLLQEQQLSQFQIYCLDDLTGIDVLETTLGSTYDWLREALSSHPGALALLQSSWQFCEDES